MTDERQNQADLLKTILRRVQRRMFLQQWMDFGVLYLYLAAVLLSFWVLATRLFPVLGDPSPVAGGMLCLVVVSAGMATLIRRPSLLRSALEADRRLGLRERLTSSFELAHMEGAMIDAVHADAMRHLGVLDVRRDFPFRIPRSSPKLAIGLVSLYLLFSLLPEFDLLHHREKEARKKDLERRIAVQVVRLQSAVRPLRKPELADSKSLASLSDQIQRVAVSLERNEITAKQSFARIAKLTEELEKQRANMRAQSPTPSLNGDLSKLGTTRSMANDIKQGDFGKAATRANDLRKQIEKKMKQGNLSKEEKARLAKELSELSKMLAGKEGNPDLAKMLAAAAESLNSDNMAKALVELEAMELSLEDLKSAMEQIEALDAAFANMPCPDGCGARAGEG